MATNATGEEHGLAPARALVTIPLLTRWSATALIGLLPATLLLVLVLVVVSAGRHGSDFATFWGSGRAVLAGRSPYPPLSSLPQQAHRLSFLPFVYPPVAAFSIVPFSLLPFAAANVLFLLANLASVALALRLLSVADWRCYAAAFASAPVFAAASMGTISPLLLLGVAALWRYRNRASRAGLLVAYAVTAKLFLWPLWLWLLRTRRFAAAGIAAATAVAAVAGTWAVIGFAGAGSYLHLLARLTGLVGPNSYSLYALERSFGLSGSTAELTLFGVAVAGAAVASVTVSGERQLLIAALTISLLATPILWPHYLVLLFAPIALVRPRLSPLWIAPLLCWFDTAAWSDGNPLRIVLLLALSLAVLAATTRLASPRAAAVTPLRAA
ncbi:MAG TPA: glycosyltransferase family 87 protein [Gaiellaceae bacterium]|nr:glycosyltransferase family 87 protein [Gaiellaceae bacterium]